MPTVKDDEFSVTTEDREFKPIEVTIKITSKDLFDKISYVVNNADSNDESIAFNAYNTDNDTAINLIDAVFRSIIESRKIYD